MRDLYRKMALLATLTACPLSTSGCATVVGTAVSPITGGVNLTDRFLSPTELGGRGNPWATPLVFLGGMIAGPFVAIYNGLNHDVTVGSFGAYWRKFPKVFKPFEMMHDV